MWKRIPEGGKEGTTNKRSKRGYTEMGEAAVFRQRSTVAALLAQGKRGRKVGGEPSSIGRMPTPPEGKGTPSKAEGGKPDQKTRTSLPRTGRGLRIKNGAGKEHRQVDFGRGPNTRCSTCMGKGWTARGKKKGGGGGKLSG